MTLHHLPQPDRETADRLDRIETRIDEMASVLRELLAEVVAFRVRYFGEDEA